MNWITGANTSSGKLKGYSGIDHGCYRCHPVEIWSVEEWNRYNGDTIMEHDKIAERMEQLGI